MAAPEVQSIVTFTVELGVDDENLVGAVRQALAREFRRTLGENVHVQVTAEVARPAPPEPERPPRPSVAEAFGITSAFFRHREP
jgi:hypothetical protein